MTNQTPRQNPYIGPRAFQTGEMLFGRDYEVHELINLLIAERIVLLHAPSGAGKSSLVQAGLIPRLVEEGFEVLPVIRVNLLMPDITVLRSFNRYIYSALLCLEERLPPEERLNPAQLSCLSLQEYLANTRARRAQQQAGAETSEKPAPNLALIFDQFEEILTVDPNDLAGKMAFFNQLGEALRDRSVWALFAMREDYLPALSPYLRPVPTHLGNTYRLDFLDVESASEAIRLPAQFAGVEFDRQAAARLIDDLRRVQVQQPDGSFRDEPGLSVEPLQLQVVCYRLWESLAGGDVYIDEQDVEALGDVNASLSEYYNQRVAEIARVTGVKERSIRAWFTEQLITPSGIRGQVMLEPGQSRGLDNGVIRLLENAHLVRAEKRGGATWYELSHDRLIKPVRDSNLAWFEANLSLLQKQAALWDTQKHPDGMLLRGNELQQAIAWAAEHAEDVSDIERRFLDECRQSVQRDEEAQQLREQRARAEAEARRAEAESRRADEQARATSRARRLVSVLAFMVLVALVSVGVAFFQSYLATNSEKAAKAAEKVAVSAGQQAAQQRDTAVVALTQVAFGLTQSAADAALIENKRQQLTAQAQEALNQVATQQALVLQMGKAPENPTAAPTATPMDAMPADPRLSQKLSQDSLTFKNEVSLPLLLAVEANQVATTFDSINALLTRVQEKLAQQNQILGLGLASRVSADAELKFSPDGSALAINTGGNVSQWDVNASLKSGQPTGAAAPQKLPTGAARGFFYDTSGNLIALVNTVGASRLQLRSNAMPQGIMVTHWDGDIDWKKVKNVAFAYMKASEGTTYVDDSFSKNWYGAKDAGILRGGVHVFKAGQDPIEQAKRFLDIAHFETGDLPPVLDLEEAVTPDNPASAYHDNVLKWLSYVKQQTGMTPIIYTALYFGKPIGIFDDAEFQEYPLWIAYYTDKLTVSPPTYGRDWIFWNFTDKGTVTGISKGVVLSYFNGSLDNLRALAYASALRNAATGETITTFRSRVNSLVSSPSGGVLAYQLADGAINIVDTVSYNSFPFASAAAQYGTAVLGINDTLKYLVLETRAGTQLLTFDGQLVPLAVSPLQDIVFSPDGQSFAAINPNGLPVIFNTSKVTAPTYSSLNFNNTTALAFNYNGSILAAGSSDGSITLYDAVEKKVLGAALAGHKGSIRGLAFHPGANILVSLGQEGQVLLWDLRTESLTARACDLAGASLTREEWDRFLPDRPYQDTCAIIKRK